MSDKQSGGLYRAAFMYNEDILKDFESFYNEKRQMPLSTRIVLGALGGVGAVYFGIMLYRNGMQLTWVGYLLICSVLLVLAFHRGGKREDETVAKYRKYYLNRYVTFSFDDDAIEMRLEGQKKYARSKYNEVYGLFDTKLCYYCTIKGQAYYVISIAGVDEGKAEDLKKYLEKKCGKKFQHYELSEK